MLSALNAMLLLVAQADVGGRGDNPSSGTGIVTILVIAAVVLVGGLLLGFAFSRVRARRRSLERRPDRAGRVGRVSKMRP